MKPSSLSLIAIAVFGILSAMIVYKAIDYKKSAQDKVRIADLHKIADGLETYKTQNGYYPLISDADSNYGITIGTTANGNMILSTGDNLTTILKDDKIMDEVPFDKMTGENGLGYVYSSGFSCPKKGISQPGQGYFLYARLESGGQGSVKTNTLAAKPDGSAFDPNDYFYELGSENFHRATSITQPGACQ